MSIVTLPSEYLARLKNQAPKVRGSKSVVDWKSLNPGQAFKLEGDLKRAKSLCASKTAKTYGSFMADVNVEQYGDESPRIVCLSRIGPPEIGTSAVTLT